MTFGEKLPKIIYGSIELDLNTMRERVVIRKKPRSVSHKFEADDHTLWLDKQGNRNVYELDIVNITKNEWDTIFADLDGQLVGYYHHADCEYEECWCDLYGYHRRNRFFHDAVHIELTQKTVVASVDTVVFEGVVDEMEIAGG